MPLRGVGAASTICGVSGVEPGIYPVCCAEDAGRVLRGWVLVPPGSAFRPANNQPLSNDAVRMVCFWGGNPYGQLGFGYANHGTYEPVPIFGQP